MAERLVEVRLEGAKELARGLGALAGELPRALADGLYREGEAIMARSRQIVPYEKGVLEASGRVEAPRVHGQNVSVRLSYGGAASAYAEVQHENESFRHDPGRQAHYLSEPAERAVAGMDARLTARLAREITRVLR